MTPLELFEEHKDWALSIAKFKADTQNLKPYADDLKQAALLGLWRACLKYERRVGGFRTYAFMRVLGEMRDMLRSFDWLPRLVRLNHESTVTQTPISFLQPADIEHTLELESRHENPLEAALQAESDRGVHVEKLLLLFPPGQARRYARTYFVEGLKAPQIAKHMKLSTSRVRLNHESTEALEEARRAARRKAAGL